MRIPIDQAMEIKVKQTTMISSSSSFAFLGTVNIPLQQIVGSANQRVKKPASTTRRIVTTIKRRSATARPTTRKN